MVRINNIAINCKLLFAITLASVLLIIPESAIYGQKVRGEAPPLRERLFFGGSFDLQLVL